MNTVTFIAVWILLVGKGNSLPVQVGPEYFDEVSCESVKESSLYQHKSFKTECIEVNIPFLGGEEGEPSTFDPTRKRRV